MIMAILILQNVNSVALGMLRQKQVIKRMRHKRQKLFLFRLLAVIAHWNKMGRVSTLYKKAKENNKHASCN